MKGPIELLQEAIEKTFKKEALIVGLVYFLITMVIAGLIAAVVIFAGGIGIIFLASARETLLSLLVIGAAGLLVGIILLTLSAALNIFAYSAFNQILNTQRYEFEGIGERIKQRLVPTILLQIFVTIIALVLFAIPAVPLYLLAGPIGLIGAVLIYIVLIIFLSPLILNATPAIILEDISVSEALRRSVSYGKTNYGLNLAAMALVIVTAIILIIPSIIPILNIIIWFAY
ncbi:MAG: hypothetical protein NUV67_06170, partial [archaeon]|nr:hypothetical protein [archaeon]